MKIDSGFIELQIPASDLADAIYPDINDEAIAEFIDKKIEEADNDGKFDDNDVRELIEFILENAEERQ